MNDCDPVKLSIDIFCTCISDPMPGIDLRHVLMLSRLLAPYVYALIDMSQRDPPSR